MNQIAIIFNKIAILLKINAFYLIEANLDDTILVGADLSGASLFQAGVQGANLTDAKLINADIEAVDFDGANLTNADLTGTKYAGLQNAIFNNTTMPDGSIASNNHAGAESKK